MLTTVSTEDLIPADHPIRRIRRVVDTVLGELDEDVRRDVLGQGPAVGAAGVVVEGVGADGVVLDPLGAGVLRAAELRPVVQVVPRPAHRRRRRSTRPRSRRTASGSWTTRSRTSSSPGSSPRPGCAATCPRDHFSVDGTLLEAWASHKSFKPKDQPPDEPPPAGPEPRGGLPRRETLERDPRVDDGPRVSAVPQVAWPPPRSCASWATC